MENEYLLDESLGYQLFQASRLMNARLNQNFSDHGYTLTYEQWQLLSRLYEGEGKTQRELAVLIERDQAGVSRLLGRMERNGYIYRRLEKENKRTNHIYLTDWAKQVKRELNDLALATIEEASEGISEQEKKAGQLFLEKVRNNLGSS
ncbi:MarR family winged helix-turn-helix transcriptional regulator [Salimicrobium flavidum]|uniref:DNA-binding transcriptional regulator, MarR family n=1 Tax=Salimicrobium flavidum TaxID=570947 RepID=A0A1N7JY62_9BACI|nr:MarR family transcriptional regulator [Salimicrobium flavidum]SIS54292.1 DNA-binding transcriptional regulator, MarR family [Salimicrobium flavidum]